MKKIYLSFFLIFISFAGIVYGCACGDPYYAIKSGNVYMCHIGASVNKDNCRIITGMDISECEGIIEEFCNEIAGADHNTFQTGVCETVAFLAEDRNNRYINGKKVWGTNTKNSERFTGNKIFRGRNLFLVGKNFSYRGDERAVHKNKYTILPTRQLLVKVGGMILAIIIGIKIQRKKRS